MRRRWAIVATLLVLLTGGGVAAWALRPEPPPTPEERTFEDIPEDEYEAWMQELGYTE